MGRPKLTTREARLTRRVNDRKLMLKRSAVIGFKRPEGFGHFDDEFIPEVKVEVVEKKAKKTTKVVENTDSVESTEEKSE